MAAVDDDEAWLYGSSSNAVNADTSADARRTDGDEAESRNDERQNNQIERTNNMEIPANNVEDSGADGAANAAETEMDVPFLEGEQIVTIKLEDREAGELSGEEFGGRGARGDEDDSDSDDDDVQVTIGDIKSAPSYGYGGAPVNLNIKRGSGYASGLPGVTGSAKTKGIDLDAIGSINGVPTYEFNLDSLEDKPWRKPGADITDYFNYGFSEDTWKAYCEKQRKLRVDSSVGVIKAGHVHGHPVKDQQIPVAAVNENSKYATRGVASAGPPPGRKASGCIDVIGGSTTTSRRPLNLSPKENVIQVMTADKRDYVRKPFIEGMPPPPPGLPSHLGPPPGFIPPDLSIPPPGLPSGLLPPGLPPPGLPPPPHPESIPTFPDHFGSFTRGGYLPPIPPGPGSERGFDGHGFPYGSTGQTPYNPFEPTGEPPWEPLDRPSSQQYNPNWDFPVSERSMDKSPQRSPNHEEDPDRRQGSRDRRERDRFRERDRERERTVDRERDRERDRHGERDRDYDYDERRERDRDRRHREHREREKEHRSSRRKHRDDGGEESEHGRSRHKRKRIKREKEDDAGGETQDSAAPEASAQEQEDAAE